MRTLRRPLAFVTALAVTTVFVSATGHASAAPVVQSAGGFTVQLLAWPSPSYLATQKVGDKVATVAVTPTTNLQALPAMYHGVGGKVRVEEDVVSNTSNATKQTGIETSAPTLQAAGFAVPAHANTPSSPSCIQGYGCTTCGSYSLHSTYSDRKEIFDNVYTWYDAPTTVDETNSSSHTLGIGYAVTGGGWSQSSDVGIETDASSSASIVYTDHEQIANEVNYGHYMAFCSNGLSVNYYRHVVEARYFDALQPYLLETQIDTSLYMGYSHCDYYPAGEFTKSVGANIDFTTGMEAPFINLSAQASYSSSTEVKFDVQSSSDVCGSNAGWAHADRMGVEPLVHCSAGVKTVLAADQQRSREARRNRPLC